MNNIYLEYELKTKYKKEEILYFVEKILNFQSCLEINDIDIWTNDYIKIKDKWKIVSAINYEPDYLKKLFSKYIKSEKNTKEYKEEYNKMLEKIGDLKNTYDKILTKKFDKNLIDWFTTFLLTENQKSKMYKEYWLDFSIWKSYSNFRINLSYQDLNNWDLWAYFSIRKINKEPFTLSQMNVNETIKNKFSLWSWLILISGPTGSAKTSTLISILDWYNKTKQKKIVTIEDPIEFYWSDLQNKSTFRQREIWKSCLSFPDWLRQAVRQDPDVIVIWEIRDPETASLAIEAANTWHLVIATIHVNSTTDVLDRILWFFDWWKSKEIATKLAWVLKFVLNQRLVTTIKNDYKVAYEWLDPTTGWLKNLIKTANLDDVRSTMYEINWNWKSFHKTLNESLFELIVKWLLTSKTAKEHYSNEVSIFDKEFTIYLKRYIEHWKLTKQEVDKVMFIAEEIEKMKSKNK